MSSSWSAQHEPIKALYHEFFGSWAKDVSHHFGFGIDPKLLDTGIGVGLEGPIKVSEVSSFEEIQFKHEIRDTKDRVVLDVFGQGKDPSGLRRQIHIKFDPDAPKGVLTEKSLRIVDLVIRLEDLRNWDTHTLQNVVSEVEDSPLDYITLSRWKSVGNNEHTWCLLFRSTQDPAIPESSYSFYMPHPIAESELEAVLNASSLRWGKTFSTDWFDFRTK